MPEITQRRIWIAVSISSILGLVILFFLYQNYGEQIPPPAEIRELLLGMLQSIPAPLYFLAFAILPAFGAPLTIFYLTALPVLGQWSPVLGIALAWCALAINMILSHWLARGILHPSIEWMLKHRQLKIPKISPENEVQITLATRLSPLPFPVQNYLLALGHASWRSYLWLSLPLQGSIGIAMMLVGESLLSGKIGFVLFAIFGLLVVTLVIKAVRKKLNREPIESID